MDTSQMFQPTLPVRGATDVVFDQIVDPWVSTHAPREGSDVVGRLPCVTPMTFQPTLPVRGATIPAKGTSTRGGWFQPTLPVRGATFSGGRLHGGAGFQPTLPVRGATS